MLTASFLFIIGLFCFIGTILSVIFTIISFANSKPSKYAWLIGFFVSLIGLILCIFLFVNKAVNKVQSLAENLETQMEETMQDFSDSLSKQMSNDIVISNNEHIKTLMSWNKDSLTYVPNQFYSYLGFQNYYRFPLKYPYSIHCSPFKDNGEMYNEKQVERFDENDNGEINVNIANISKLALDQNYILMEQLSIINNKAQKTYCLFNFNNEEQTIFTSTKELFKCARSKGYKGADTLMSIETYAKLFE